MASLKSIYNITLFKDELEFIINVSVCKLPIFSTLQK